MIRGGDERAVSAIVGAVLLLGLFVTALALYQVSVVPSENERAEISHNQEAHNEMVTVRNAILNAGSEREASRSAAVTLGTQYPARTFSINPPDPQGNLELSEPGGISFDNVEVRGSYIGDGDPDQVFDAEHPTQSLVYQPGYNEYTDAPDTRLEHGALFNDFGETTVPLADDGVIVEENRITLVLLEGELSQSGSQTMAVDARTISGPTDPITIVPVDEDDPITLDIPTDQPDYWNETVAEDQLVTSESYDGDERSLTLELEPGVGEYEVQLARVGVGEMVSRDDSLDIRQDPTEDEEFVFDGNATSAFDLEWETDHVSMGLNDQQTVTVETDPTVDDGLADFAVVDEDGVLEPLEESDREVWIEDGEATITLESTDGTGGGDATVFVSSGGGFAELEVSVESADVGFDVSNAVATGEDTSEVEFTLEPDEDVTLEELSFDSVEGSDAERINNVEEVFFGWIFFESPPEVLVGNQGEIDQADYEESVAIDGSRYGIDGVVEPDAGEPIDVEIGQFRSGPLDPDESLESMDGATVTFTVYYVSNDGAGSETLEVEFEAE